MNPLRLVGIGFCLLLTSWVAVFLMVLRVLSPDLLLALASYTVSVVGLGLGLVGAALWSKSRWSR